MNCLVGSCFSYKAEYFPASSEQLSSSDLEILQHGFLKREILSH